MYQTIQYFLSFFEYLDRSAWWTLKENDRTEYVLGHGDRSRDEPMRRLPWPERRVSPKVRQCLWCSARPISTIFLIGFRVRPGLSRIAIRHRQSDQKADLTGAIPLLYEFNNTSGSEIADENSPI
jgi:hypothetical protein